MNSRTVNGMKCFLYLSALLAFTLPVQGASFDCRKASTKVEHMICDDPELSKLDEELSTAYKTALQNETQADSTKQAQKQWIKERNGCSDTACMKSAYAARLRVLPKGNEPATQLAAAQPAQAKAETPTQPPVEDTACITPNIDWRNYEWTLITGNGVPVCEEMLAYVKSRPKDVAPPTCPDERLPSNGNWSQPEVRILSEEEKQTLLRDIPEKYRQKPHGPVSYELEIAHTSLLRVIRGDITGDGIPENLLAFNVDGDPRQMCERSKRCARPGEITNHWIELTSDVYDLLPMNDEGTLVNWSHRAIYPNQLRGGVLVYYKELPYWMSIVSWSQYFQDHFSPRHPRPDDPYSAIFSLALISSYNATDSKNRSPNFKDVTAISIDRDPESNNVCRFGYFHRDNLKQNPPVRRK